MDYPPSHCSDPMSTGGSKYLTSGNSLQDCCANLVTWHCSRQVRQEQRVWPKWNDEEAHLSHLFPVEVSVHIKHISANIRISSLHISAYRNRSQCITHISVFIKIKYITTSWETKGRKMFLGWKNIKAILGIWAQHRMPMGPSGMPEEWFWD